MIAVDRTPPLFQKQRYERRQNGELGGSLHTVSTSSGALVEEVTRGWIAG
jgi:hypothetical protein